MLICLQGPSGGGKSTVAKELAIKHNAAIHSTDAFFINEAGDYRFDGKKLPVYHKMNQDRTWLALKEGKNVIVDNTNLRNYEVRPYVEAALKFGHDVQFIRVDGNYKNIHGVPDEKVKQMRANMEDLSIEAALKAKAPWDK